MLNHKSLDTSWPTLPPITLLLDCPVAKKPTEENLVLGYQQRKEAISLKTYSSHAAFDHSRINISEYWFKLQTFFFLIFLLLPHTFVSLWLCTCLLTCIDWREKGQGSSCKLRPQTAFYFSPWSLEALSSWGDKLTAAPESITENVVEICRPSWSHDI